MKKDNKIHLTEAQFREKLIDMIREALDDANMERIAWLDKRAQEQKPFFDKFRNQEGKIDDNAIVLDCLSYLKKTNLVFDNVHNRIKLDNGCTIELPADCVEDKDLSLWMIVLPSGEIIDGTTAEESDVEDDGTFLSPEVSAAMERELAYHIIWK